MCLKFEEFQIKCWFNNVRMKLSCSYTNPSPNEYISRSVVSKPLRPNGAYHAPLFMEFSR